MTDGFYKLIYLVSLTLVQHVMRQDALYFVYVDGLVKLLFDAG